MNLSTILTLLGASGFFASRAFTTAFLSAVCLRFGDSIPVLKNVDMIKAAAAHPPTWFTGNTSLLVLGVLAVAEIFGDKVPELQEILSKVNTYGKTAVAGLASFGIISTADAGFIESNTHLTAALAGGDFVYQAGLIGSVLSVIVAGMTLGLGLIRGAALGILAEADADDSLGFRKLISWMEDLWVACGLFVLIIYPVVIITVLAGCYALLALWRWWQHRREEQSRQPCAKCGELVRSAALCCPRCAEPNPTPKGLTWLGAMDSSPAGPPEEHRLLLATKKRCPCCAKRLPERKVRQFCPECGRESFADSEFAGAYLGHLNVRLMVVLVVCTLLSLVPVFGLIAGVLYYRAKLVSPLRCYLSFGRSFFLRMVLRCFHFALIIFQLMPGLGAVSVPLMALTSYLVYKGAFESGLDEPAVKTSRR